MKESKQSMGWCRLSYELMQDSNLTDKDILLYSIMLDCCDAELTCTISRKEVTELSCGRIPQKTFYRCIDRLERFGYLEHDKTGRENVYRLADIIGLKRQKQKPIIRQSRRAPEEVPAPEEQQELKLKYGQFQTVELTMNQFDRLVSDFGETKTLAYIRKLDEYSHEHGKQYSDCDFTIRKWIAEDAHKPETQKAEKDVKRKERVQKYMELVN